MCVCVLGGRRGRDEDGALLGVEVEVGEVEPGPEPPVGRRQVVHPRTLVRLRVVCCIILYCIVLYIYIYVDDADR